MQVLIVEPDPETADQIIVFSIMTRCKRLLVLVKADKEVKEVVIERFKDKLVVKNGAYVAKRITIKYPSEKQYLFYRRTADGTVEIEAETLY